MKNNKYFPTHRCDTLFYATSSPLTFNVTLLNAMGVTGEIVGAPVWLPAVQINFKFVFECLVVFEVVKLNFFMIFM